MDFELWPERHRIQGDDGTVFEFPAYTAPVTKYREVTGTCTLVEGRKHRGDADMHSLRIGISYRF